MNFPCDRPRAHRLSFNCTVYIIKNFVHGDHVVRVGTDEYVYLPYHPVYTTFAHGQDYDVDCGEALKFGRKLRQNGVVPVVNRPVGPLSVWPTAPDLSDRCSSACVARNVGRWIRNIQLIENNTRYTGHRH